MLSRWRPAHTHSSVIGSSQWQEWRGGGLYVRMNDRGLRSGQHVHTIAMDGWISSPCIICMHKRIRTNTNTPACSGLYHLCHRAGRVICAYLHTDTQSQMHWMRMASEEARLSRMHEGHALPRKWTSSSAAALEKARQTLRPGWGCAAASWSCVSSSARESAAGLIGRSVCCSAASCSCIPHRCLFARYKMSWYHMNKTTENMLIYQLTPICYTRSGPWIVPDTGQLTSR